MVESSQVGETFRQETLIPFFTADAGFADFEGTLEQSLAFLVPAQVDVNGAEIVQARGHVQVIDSLANFTDLQTPQRHLPRFLIAPSTCTHEPAD